MIETRPRVVHVTTTDISLELLLGNQLSAFAAAGYDVIGVSAPGPFVPALEQRGIRHVPLRHATRSFAPLEDARALGELVSVFRRLRPAIVHTHNPKPGLYGRVAAQIARVPVVVNTVHGLYAQVHDRFARRAMIYGMERIAGLCSNRELVQNPEDVATLRRIGVPERKLTLLGNGIDLGRFDPATISGADRRATRGAELGAIAPDDVVVGLVGRLVREKGYSEVFDAASRLRDQVPALRFAVVGWEDDDDAKADALDAGDRERAAAAGVRFLGGRDDVARLYSGMDIFVLASHREGYPRSAMEAAAMGVPVIATDIRGCRQVVDHGRTGLLVPARDATALTAAIASLASDPDRRAQLGVAGREKAARDFDERRCTAITLEAYRALLAAAGASGSGRSVVTEHPVAAGLTLRFANLEDVDAVASLHASRISEGFLVTLGPAFLRRLYRRVVLSHRSFLLVADDTRTVCGFIAVAESTRTLYREFLLHDGFAAVAAARGILRAPRSALETLRYGLRAGNHAGAAAGSPAEILSTGVSATHTERGIGSGLVRATVEELTRRGVATARVVTAVGNDAAVRAYERGGFRRCGRDVVHRGVTQELLVWP